MALAVAVQIDFKDSKGKTSFTRVHIPTGFTIAQYVSFAQDLAQAAADITSCIITGVSISFGLDLSGATLTNVQSTLASVTSKALMQFKSAVSGFKARFNIPTYDEDNLTVVGTDQVDIAQTPVATFITGCVSGYTLGDASTLAPVDKYGNDLTENDIAREIFTKNVSA